jgi:hypothetical protein
MDEIRIGEEWGRGRYRRRILDKRPLGNGWYLIKTENGKSERDFKVKVIFSFSPRPSMTPKHAHFVIDFYGKICADRQKAEKVLAAIVEVWQGNPVAQVLSRYQQECERLPGYPLEYILNALDWILEQEDINFTSRPGRKQSELDEVCKRK